MSHDAKVAIILSLIGLAAFGALIWWHCVSLSKQSERERFQCPPSLAEMRQNLSGKTIAELRLDNGEAACFLNHVAKEFLDKEGKF